MPLSAVVVYFGFNASWIGFVFGDMARFAPLFWLICLISCQAEFAVNSDNFTTPSIISSEEDVTLNDGDVFHQRCVSSEPVRWVFQSNDEDVSSRVSTNHSLREDGLHLTTIKVNGVNHLDVGYKYCVLNTTGSEHTAWTDTNSASLYLYVNDSEHLLSLNSSQELTFLNVFEGMRAVVVCKPTAPDINVTLVSLHSPPVSVESIFIYDPHHGFIVEKITRDMFLQSLFNCQARRLSQIQNHKILLNFVAQKKLLSNPIVQVLGPRNIVEGYNFSLRCSIPVSDSVELSWEIPGASTGLKIGRMVTDRQKTTFAQILLNQPPQEVYIRELHVRDARLEDAGSYQCFARDDVGNSESSVLSIVIHGRNSSSIKLIAHSLHFKALAGDSLTVAIEVDAYPAPDFSWYRPDGVNIEEANVTGKYFVFSPLNSIVLEMRNLTLHDSGMYRLEARNREVSDTLYFNITVTDQARTSIDDGPLYYTAKKRHILQCHATGFPLPHVWWQFTACFSDRPCLTAVNVSEELSTNMSMLEEKQISASEIVSRLQVTAVQSGSYSCLASNGPEISESSLNFVVTDVPGGFGAAISDGVVVSGNPVYLTCTANRFDFPDSSALAWYYHYGGNLEPVGNDRGWIFKDEPTRFSFRKIISTNAVSQTSSGNYTCRAQNVRGVVRSADVALRVLDAEAPVFLDWAGMNSSDTLVVDPGEAVVFNCSVSGLPTPDIVWYKNGERFGGTPLNGQQRFRLVDGGQRLWLLAAIGDDSGRYHCRASNREGAVTGAITLFVPSAGHSAYLVVGVAVVILLVFVPISVLLLLKIRKQKNLQHRLTARDLETFSNGLMSQYNPVLSIEEQAELLPYDFGWEFPKQRLILGRQIGSGAFGRVVKAEAIGILPNEERTVVAVKMPRSESDPCQIKSLMAELKIMIQLGRHLNVVNLLGAVTRLAYQGEFYVLVEYCRYGNLHDYLLKHKASFISQLDSTTGEYTGDVVNCTSTSTSNPADSIYKVPRARSRDGSTADSSSSLVDWSTSVHREDSCPLDDGMSRFVSRSEKDSPVTSTRRVTLTTRDLIHWSYQVASGMQYLASRKLLHGDLAARNILLADKSIVKISDFGLSRDIYKTQDYKKTGKGLLPVKWMAIESIQDSIFSTESDVWSFGVVLWELFSLGSSPYPGMEYDINFIRHLCDGYRMTMPPMCPKSLYRLMLLCWSHLPSDRPTFSSLVSTLSQQLEEGIVQEYRRCQLWYDSLNEDYFSKRAIYINQIAFGDYQNVDAGRASAGEVTHMLDTAVTDIDTNRQMALFSKSPSTVSSIGGTGSSVSPGAVDRLSPAPEDSQHYLVPRNLNHSSTTLAIS